MIRAALADARLRPSEVDVVEAHGTGTRLGDPIEAQALLATYGQDARGPPLWLGSVKSNIGHTQAAAGVAGIIKMVDGDAARRPAADPARRRSHRPHVDWTAGAVELLTETRTWPYATGRAEPGCRRSGSAAPTPTPSSSRRPTTSPSSDAAPVGLLPVPVFRADRGGASSSRPAACSTAERGALPDVAFSLATGRASLPNRAVVLAGDDAELVRGLTALADGTPDPGVVRGDVRPGSLAVLFTGQGAQRAGMGRGSTTAFPVYAEAFDAVCAEFDRLLDRPLREVVFTGSSLGETGSTQPALFAVEVALFRLVESFGVRPDFVAGHSIGEISAAHVAGVLSLVDACRAGVRAGVVDAGVAGRWGDGVDRRLPRPTSC